MNRRIPVFFVCLLTITVLLASLPASLLAVETPTSCGLTEFAVRAMQEKWGYVYGTYGQKITDKIIDGKRGQYPDMYDTVMKDGRNVYEHALAWIGGRAADCAGLLKAYLWWQDDTSGPRYSAISDQSANDVYAAAVVKGPIETIPRTHGVLVWRKGHIGIYIGNGEVIESRGVMHGVVKTKLSERNWTNWCLFARVAYPSTGWVKIGVDRFYYQDGQYLTGNHLIDGVPWQFGANGALRNQKADPTLPNGQTDPAIQKQLPTQAAETVAAALRKSPDFLSYGDQGDDVLALQVRLFALNLFKTTPGGHFGPYTERAVKTLQALNGLPETGVMGTAETELIGRTDVVAGKPELKPSDSGYEVLRLQERLSELGYDSGPKDGVFSTTVAAALNLFQLQNDLPENGIADFATQCALFDTMAPKLAPPPFLGAALKRGSRGDDVRRVQKRLHALGYLDAPIVNPVDGIFGSQTAQAVCQFQRAAGLPVNGRVDMAVIAILFQPGAPMGK